MEGLFEANFMDLKLLTYLEGFLTEKRRQRFAEILSLRTRYLTVALEDVFQMHNASAVVRSCDVFGIQDAHLVEERFGQRLDKNIALGAQKWVDIHRHDTSLGCLEQLKGKGYRIVATSPHADGYTPADLPLDRPTAIFFGTEKEGLSPTVLEQADAHLTIPMVGFTESLNISVAAAIVLYEVSNRLRATDIPWGLTEEEILEKRLDWARKTIKSVDEIIARFQASP